MANIKFKLKAMRSVTVRALNGKPYTLKAGMNELELDYSDYVSLMKALGMKPLPMPKSENTFKPAEKKADTKKEESKIEDPKMEEPKVEELKSEPIEEPKAEEPEPVKEEVIEEEHKAEEPAGNDEEAGKEVDYASMPYSQLKAEYKKVTGKSCKLKKDEIIQFLQENSHAEQE
jgi:hypothetical protein